MTEPMASSSPRRSVKRMMGSIKPYEMSGTMDRLRAGMVGGSFGVDIEEYPTGRRRRRLRQRLHQALGQIPAIALIGMFHLMIGVPFGVSYFPVGWRRDDTLDDTDNNPEAADAWVHGPFPLAGKEALGIRMFLFSTIVGQVVFTLASNFQNPIGLQMVENVPFCHELSAIVIAKQGYGMEALATLMVLFGLASIVVGVVFYLLGKLQLGRIVYFFPAHALVGCIGGIGVFIAKTGLEVTINARFGVESLWQGRILLGPVLAFEVALRVLEQVTKDEQGKPRFSLLSPIYFCMITPIFYLILWVLGVPNSQAEQAGFFFPSLQDDSTSSCSSSMDCSTGPTSMLRDEHLFDIWRLMDFSLVSWRTIFVDCVPTLVALTLFSLIHVPINIPAFAISTKTDVEMNDELIAHGYSNLLAGFGGGLQNYMAYTVRCNYTLFDDGCILAFLTFVNMCFLISNRSYTTNPVGLEKSRGLPSPSSHLFSLSLGRRSLRTFRDAWQGPCCCMLVLTCSWKVYTTLTASLTASNTEVFG